jgi:catechol 2,3-dioxygenase
MSAPNLLVVADTERTIADLSVGSVSLRVSDLARSLAFYTQAIGMTLIDRSGEGARGSARLGTPERELLELQGVPEAPPTPARATGLYHFAILLPARGDLARFLADAHARRLPFVGFADHYVSEALYLADPDGHGIELYADRPRELWEGQVAQRMTTLPLDFDSLLAELPDAGGEELWALPAGARIGHIHFKVADIESTIAFYRDLLGLELMAQLGSRAAFFARGGYHHQIGANSWESAGGAPPAPEAIRLLETTLLVAGERRLAAMIDRVEAAGGRLGCSPHAPILTDPSGNRLRLALDAGQRARR